MHRGRALALLVTWSACGRIGFDRTDPPSCIGLPATCGPTGNRNCCEHPVVIGGTYYRSYDVAGDGLFPDMSYPATVRPFRLDKFEVTVGRFRQFVEAGMGTQANPPVAGEGQRTLNGMANQGGWDETWNAMLVSDTPGLLAAVKCSVTSPYAWTDTPGDNEHLPMNCISWYEAMAFCIWDGGYLPTESEWNYAAAGGSAQRAYPWSTPDGSTTIDCTYANFGGPSWPTTACVGAGVIDVGATSPQGDGRWGHSDLGGNVWEWIHDVYVAPYPTTTCDDCATLGAGSLRAYRGGGFYSVVEYLRGANRDGVAPTSRDADLGARCARAP